MRQNRAYFRSYPALHVCTGSAVCRTACQCSLVLILRGTVILYALLWYWVGLFYESMWYELRDDEINWKRGVWFRTTGIIAYNRITNLDVRQGPFMRFLGISNLSIQTAGYSGQAMPEILIEAIEHAEELRELIRSMVRGSPARDDGTGNSTVSPVNGSPAISRSSVSSNASGLSWRSAETCMFLRCTAPPKKVTE